MASIKASIRHFLLLSDTLVLKIELDRKKNIGWLEGCTGKCCTYEGWGSFN